MPATLSVSGVRPSGDSSRSSSWTPAPSCRSTASATSWRSASRRCARRCRASGAAIGGTHLLTEPPGYRLAATAIDATRFRELCRDARHAPPDRAVDLLDAAVDLWRGDAFAEFADQDWVHPETVSLAEQRADAIEDRAEALIAIGRYGDAVASLERHTVDQPLATARRG